MSVAFHPSRSRRIIAADIHLAVWLVLACVAAEVAYIGATWERPGRLMMVVACAAAVVTSTAMWRWSGWIVADQRRAFRLLPTVSVGYVTVVAYLSSTDGGAASPIALLLFVPVAYSALTYPVREAFVVSLSGLVAFVVLVSIYSAPRAGGAFLYGAALASTAAIGLLQARWADRAAAELGHNEEALVTSERRFRGSFEHSLVGMALLDRDENYIEVNDALCRMLGRDAEWLKGRSPERAFRAVTHPDDLARDASVTRGLVEGAFDHTQFEKRYIHADGHLVHALVSKSVVRDDEGEVVFFHLQAVDVTEQREEAQRSRRRARQQAAVAAIGQRALDGAPFAELIEECVVAVQDTLQVAEIGIAELLPDKNIIFRAARGYEIGLVAPAGPGTSLAGLALTTGGALVMDDAETEKRFAPVVARERGVRSGLSVPIPGPDGAPFGVFVAGSRHPHDFQADDVNFLEALATVLGSALSRDAAERRLRHLSLHDALTGLPNRALLLDRLGHALDRAQRTDEVLAVMFIDVDHFKTVNDAYGHDAGDELLRVLTPRLRRVRRIGDTLARFGGDEFVLLCEGLTDAADAVALAERVLAVFKAPFVLGADTEHPTEHHLSASIGVAVAGPEHEGDPAALIRDADIAMYRAKQTRGRVELFEPTARTRVVERVRTTGELRRAIDEGELRIVYQPQVDLRDGAVRAFEALLRWEHAERGLVSPSEFIPVAEESGLVLPMGEWVLETVLAQLARWGESGDPLLADAVCGVNLSARQLGERWLPDMVADALARHRVDPARLVCEITETALIDDPHCAAENVEALTAHGVAVTLDDFGTGYSALEHLKRYSLAGIKLDRTFVADVATNVVDTAVVRALVEMAAAMGLETVAEGIETPEQLAHLRVLGCDRAQGFLFSAGLPAEEIPALLRALPGGRFDLEAIDRGAPVVSP